MYYLKAYSAGSIIATSWRIYFREWRTIFLILILPMTAAHVLSFLIKHTGTLGTVVGSLATLFAQAFIIFPTVVAVSEVCLDIRPTVARSYRRAFARPGRLFGAYFLTVAIVFGGFILLLIPGILFSVWYMLVGPVVVLEALTVRATLKRSRELGRGYYWRNFGTLFGGSILVLIPTMLIAGIAGASIGYLTDAGPWRFGVAELVGNLMGLIAAPPLAIMPVLLYYDMRARKEGYAAAQLAEELRF
ncbi:hypothetical protein ABIB73_004575 [Bradyrhizobium sp. F1.4.3]|uniref:hypothetical protein n=1 Tax=Bradyrhizobium sp. F1.4.3 TaxID=3156356 RepID=UPI00339ACE16